MKLRAVAQQMIVRSCAVAIDDIDGSNHPASRALGPMKHWNEKNEGHDLHVVGG